MSTNKVSQRQAEQYGEDALDLLEELESKGYNKVGDVVYRVERALDSVRQGNFEDAWHTLDRAHGTMDMEVRHTISQDDHQLFSRAADVLSDFYIEVEELRDMGEKSSESFDKDNVKKRIRENLNSESVEKRDVVTVNDVKLGISEGFTDEEITISLTRLGPFGNQEHLGEIEIIAHGNEQKGYFDVIEH